MVDRFDLSREQPQKMWWKERPVTPATFFGFPDVTKHGLRGGSLYVEQMDSVTLAVLADKCVKENIQDPDIWTKFSWRAQQLACRTYEPDLVYLFRAFSRADWYDQNLLTTYLGRLHRRLHSFHLPDIAVVLEAFSNPRFRLSTYLQKTMLHLVLLLQHRDDAKVTDLARCCAALCSLRPLQKELEGELRQALELLAEALLVRDLGDLSPSRTILAINSFVAWGLLNPEKLAGESRSTSCTDVCWALVRELRGKLRAHGRERPDELATLALALADGGLNHEDIWAELVHNLEHEAYRLSGAGVCAAIWGTTKAKRCTGPLFEGLARRLGEQHSKLSPADCALGAPGFLRGPAAVAERAVLRGPLGERILELGLPAFSAVELARLLGGLARASPDAWGVEVLAAAALEEFHGRLGRAGEELSAETLCSVARSLGYLRPGSSEVLAAVVDRAQAAIIADLAAPSAVGEDEVADDGAPIPLPGGPSPRHLAMLCQGIAQLAQALPDAPARLDALLPLMDSSLAAAPSVVTSLTMLAALVRCPPSPRRSDVLDKLAQELAKRAHELPAASLVSLSAALSAAKVDGGEGAWASPPKLLERTVALLDMKRYDLQPGALGRAAASLEAAGAPVLAEFGGPLRLEARDRSE